MGIGYNPKIVTQDLVLYLDAANNKSYPGSGNTWFDLSGKNNNAAISGSLIFENNYALFNGANSFATITSNQTSLNFTSEQTIIVWFNHDMVTGRTNIWDQAYGGYGTWTHENGADMNYYYGTAGSNALPYTNLKTSEIGAGTPRNTWICLASVRNTSTLAWYKNGTQLSSQNNPYGNTGTTTANIRIGLGYAVPGYWTGKMATVIAYNRALTAAEVKQNFNALRGRFGV